MPPMVGGIFYEHGHRIVASFVGFLTLVLAFWTAARERRRGVRRLAWAALAAVVVQGLLGGITVLYLLPTAVSVAHACLAQTFFCLTIALACATSREWLAAAEPSRRPEDAPGARSAWALATGVTWAQLLLGAVMRHTGAGLAIPDFPLALGRIVPPLDTAPVVLHFSHRLTALAVLACVGLALLRSVQSREPRLVRLGWIAACLTLAQAALGATTVLTGKAVLPTTAHVATGAALLGACWLLTLRSFRLLRGARARLAETSPGQAGAVTA
jgi:cytochrome c oxidase assembly protein subunit 15